MSINIKEENKGKFTKQAKSKGMSVQEFARKVLNNKNDYSSTTVKRANFARNASKWNRLFGGSVNNKLNNMNYYKNGGSTIPERYKNMGFTKVGQKKKSNRSGKKWMVLAKKGDSYKVVHGGDSNMKDFSQHKDKSRKDKFWSRMGGKNSAKAKDPFSPLYWHKRFGTWRDGGYANTVEEYQLGLLAGKNKFRMPFTGNHNMTMTPKGMPLDFPIYYQGLVNNTLSDQGIALPGQDFSVYGNEVREYPLYQRGGYKYQGLDYPQNREKIPQGTNKPVSTRPKGIIGNAFDFESRRVNEQKLREAQAKVRNLKGQAVLSAMRLHDIVPDSEVIDQILDPETANLVRTRGMQPIPTVDDSNARIKLPTDNKVMDRIKGKKGGYLKDKNTYVTKDGKETRRGLWANVYLKNKKKQLGGNAYNDYKPITTYDARERYINLPDKRGRLYPVVKNYTFSAIDKSNDYPSARNYLADEYMKALARTGAITSRTPSTDKLTEEDITKKLNAFHDGNIRVSGVGTIAFESANKKIHDHYSGIGFKGIPYSEIREFKKARKVKTKKQLGDYVVPEEDLRFDYTDPKKVRNPGSSWLSKTVDKFRTPEEYNPYKVQSFDVPIASMMYNLSRFAEGPDKEPVRLNNQMSNVLSTMKYNRIRPNYRPMEMAQTVANRQIRGSVGSIPQMLANQQNVAANTQAKQAEAALQAANANAQLQGQYAQQASLEGRTAAAEQARVDDLNQRNKAANYAHLAALAEGYDKTRGLQRTLGDADIEAGMQTTAMNAGTPDVKFVRLPNGRIAQYYRDPVTGKFKPVQLQGLPG